MENITNSIINGDAFSILKKMDDASVDCIVTSPPYYKQRDYGNNKQIGLEESPEEYIEKLRGIFKECYRVLKNDGTLWLNLGDKYIDGRQLGLPWRVAFEIMKDGWLLRNDIIWHKPNAMPTSVKNRLTVDHEYLFFFSKQKNKYYFDQDSIREEHITFSENSKMKGGRNHFGKKGGTPEEGKNKGSVNLHNGRWDQAFHPKGRNKRTVWNVSLSKFRGAHFAVFPEKLIEPCILAGCKPEGVVLDPFSGSGTTAMVANKLNRKFIGIELNTEYIKISLKRLNLI